LEFERQKCPIPSGVFGELVVCNHVRPDLSGRQMVDPHGRDIAHAKELCRLDPAVAGDDSIGAFNQDRIDKPKFCDACGDLSDLPARMRPRVLCPRLSKLGTVDEQEAQELAAILRPKEARQQPCDDTVYYRPAYFRLPQSPLVRSME
jgi:hypothetical protein